ncbi:MAG: D-alanine--D-alanine ligase [Candidatus Bipolaricaulota bacterium]|nr:D-alanine--D-alanine ligase [Candidatus Bipolaricaulota bacterium]MBS3791134.1 D-alanine--D-alanine ligase [Candidatus Bipolaricaulota bacterium]
MVKLDEELDICVLMGGTSSEREVSLKSGNNVYEALKKGRKEFNPIKGEFSHEDEILDLVVDADIVFNTLHGGIGEDGTIQALLDILDIAYTGTGPLGSSIAMNKLYSKEAFRRASIKTPDYVEGAGRSFSLLIDLVSDELTYPVIVKPVGEGSSRGVEIADNEEDLIEKIDQVRTEYGRLFIEEYIDGKEVTAGVLDEDGEPTPLPLVEMNVERERFFNFTAKYTPGETEFICPARVPDSLAESVKDQALRAHSEFECRGYSRVDFMLGQEKEIYGLEVNTLPGMTETSDLPQAAREAGIDFGELVERMAISALD